MAFQLYCNGMPSVIEYKDVEERLEECMRYTIKELFCYEYVPYLGQAIQLQYSEYTTENKEMYHAFGGYN